MGKWSLCLRRKKKLYFHSSFPIALHATHLVHCLIFICIFLWFKKRNGNFIFSLQFVSCSFFKWKGSPFHGKVWSGMNLLIFIWSYSFQVFFLFNHKFLDFLWELFFFISHENYTNFFVHLLLILGLKHYLLWILPLVIVDYWWQRYALKSFNF
jgi:hypothetical protein